VDATGALTKVHVDLPNHWAVGGEALWARALGDDLYEIQNIPYYAYGLNFGDVVVAKAEREDLKPSVLSVLRRSGNRTLRVVFDAALPAEERVPFLETLAGFGAGFENANGLLFAIDVEAGGDYDGVCGALAEREAAGVLQYETCEERQAGMFDEGDR
jgi:Domain of unknown function (DUF4265)